MLVAGNELDTNYLTWNLSEDATPALFDAYKSGKLNAGLKKSLVRSWHAAVPTHKHPQRNGPGYPGMHHGKKQRIYMKRMPIY